MRQELLYSFDKFVIQCLSAASIQFIDHSIVSGIEDTLRKYGQETRDKIYQSAGRDVNVRGNTHGDYWEPYQLSGIYLAMKSYINSAEHVVQIAGGVSPLLDVLQKMHPETRGKLIAYDIDPHFKSFSDIFDHTYITGDAKKFKSLELEKPSLVFSYYFLDRDYFVSSRFNEGPYENERIEELVGGIVDGLPGGSVLVTQVLCSHYRLPRGHYRVLDRLREGTEGVTWKALNSYESLQNSLVMLESENRFIQSVVMVSKKVA